MRWSTKRSTLGLVTDGLLWQWWWEAPLEIDENGNHSFGLMLGRIGKHIFGDWWEWEALLWHSFDMMHGSIPGLRLRRFFFDGDGKHTFWLWHQSGGPKSSLTSSTTSWHGLGTGQYCPSVRHLQGLGVQVAQIIPRPQTKARIHPPPKIIAGNALSQ